MIKQDRESKASEGGYNPTFNSLNELEQRVLKERYENHKTIVAIAKEIPYDQDHLFKVHNKAVLKLMKKTPHKNL